MSYVLGDAVVGRGGFRGWEGHAEQVKTVEEAQNSPMELRWEDRICLQVLGKL